MNKKNFKSLLKQVKEYVNSCLDSMKETDYFEYFLEFEDLKECMLKNMIDWEEFLNARCNWLTINNEELTYYDISEDLTEEQREEIENLCDYLVDKAVEKTVKEVEKNERKQSKKEKNYYIYEYNIYTNIKKILHANISFGLATLYIKTISDNSYGTNYYIANTKNSRKWTYNEYTDEIEEIENKTLKEDYGTKENRCSEINN